MAYTGGFHFFTNSSVGGLTAYGMIKLFDHITGIATWSPSSSMYMGILQPISSSTEVSSSHRGINTDFFREVIGDTLSNYSRKQLATTMWRAAETDGSDIISGEHQFGVARTHNLQDIIFSEFIPEIQEGDKGFKGWPIFDAQVTPGVSGSGNMLFYSNQYGFASAWGITDLRKAPRQPHILRYNWEMTGVTSNGTKVFNRKMLDHVFRGVSYNPACTELKAFTFGGGSYSAIPGSSRTINWSGATEETINSQKYIVTRNTNDMEWGTDVTGSTLWLLDSAGNMVSPITDFEALNPADHDGYIIKAHSAGTNLAVGIHFSSIIVEF